MSIKISEKQLEKQCMDLLRAERWLVFQTHGHQAFKSAGDVGQCDLVAVKDTRWGRPIGEVRVLLLELKTPKGRRSTDQIAWAEKAKRLCFEVDVIRSIEELKAIL